MPRPGNSQHSTTIKPTTASPFAIRFHNGRWQVKKGSIWLTAREISLLASAIATPNGEICGVGVVTKHGSVYTVTA
jgi:hypothetical protein